MTDRQALFRLVYVSRVRPLAGREAQELEIKSILAASRRNNAANGITGALLFNADCFAQTIEGPMIAVETLFERIQRDDRHTEPVILKAQTVADREFGDWSMAYAGRHESERLRFDALTGVPGGEGQGRVLSLLRDVVLRAAPTLATAS